MWYYSSIRAVSEQRKYNEMVGQNHPCYFWQIANEDRQIERPLHAHAPYLISFGCRIFFNMNTRMFTG